ncbi:MAG: bifunctional 3-deoxy-7-phosphoheptulonate synthase/chorismate mutase type II [Bacteroidales bacterium]|nr:bifunctional 3-deoxy-7-phosphoheptulonate synthase/chorismate mutase type II [Bacteroidales bacterium]
MFTPSSDRPLIVAGPCSVESRSQLEAVTRSLSAMPQVRLLRAGVWKPRTRPGGFEGLGQIALKWMQELAAEYGIGYCCEVASPTHVELCLRYGIRAVWIGARTTANPFMVDELCSALRGTAMAVMVKNPVCPDVGLWQGAVERLQAAGITDLAAIHRGFNVYNNRGYRNAPMWEVAMEFRRQCPQVPILCDPSHMAGRADLVPSLASAALQLAYDGLMLEVHPSPAEAWSDAAQQLSPQQLQALLADWLHPHPSPTDAPPSLLPLREQIDDIDHDLLALLAQRMDISRRIAAIKHQQHLPVYQSLRWTAVMDDRLQQAARLGLDQEFTRELMEKIHSESIRQQIE